MSYRSEVLADSSAAYWEMGYGGRVFDTVGGAHEVSRTGIVKPVPGIRAFEGAMYFGRMTGALSAYSAARAPGRR